ncbi:protein kinase [Rhodococcus sp. WMMA185]|uniref:DUF6764 family protein n=1 Tax=Rhodococcus sp. WMMA185 TaxID=679318 RepID=UPI0008790E6A|nr:DUF6764 family protein [Rhodococcus sp. WMMA185]AOW91680.1 protein kinase [Rhodococcus sp. WMMA185]
MEHTTATTAGVLLGVAAAAFGILTSAPTTASAVPLSCTGQAGLGETAIVDRTACGAIADPGSSSSAFGNDGVGFADAAQSGVALGVGLDGGVGAAEARGGAVAAVAVGPESVAIGTVAETGPALVLSGPGGQALVAEPDRGVVCAGGPSLAVNFSARQACLNNGSAVWQLPDPTSASVLK